MRIKYPGRMPTRFPAILLALQLAATASIRAEQSHVLFRPPSVPLVAHDPYFSIWSPADKLADADTVHWTGKPHRLTSLVQIDGKAFRLMGKEPANVPALPQTGVEVLPTRTIYTFEGEGVRLTLTFMTPALPDDLEVLSRPLTYVIHDVRAADNIVHDVAFYFDASAELTVNNPQQPVTWAREDVGDLVRLKIGSKGQSILAKKGDDLRIDWGQFNIAAPKLPVQDALVDLRFGLLPNLTGVGFKSRPAPTQPAAAKDKAGALILNPGKVSSESVSCYLMLAYDDEFSIQYMKQNLRPYWRRNGDDAAALLKKAASDYESLKNRCEQFDAELMADLRKAGGEKYARLCALAYRQCLAGCKVVADANGQPLLFPKENTSNGCIGTSDVIYPMSPQFLLFSPSLTKAMLVPILDYAASPRWKFPFAPHDLGTYPHANGQVYGGGERTEQNQMPVEESANLLILVAALAHMEGNADFAGKYWSTLTKWADYLKQKGFDPENQLCTDDFLGHQAHNVNLSAKAMLGLASYGRLCEMRGDKPGAAEYGQLAREFSQRWVKEADDGDHFRLTFDKPGTWSQKYNLVWDRILGLGLFPDSVRRKEMDHYKKAVRPFGLPLDNRSAGAKLDWSLWTATLTQDPADFAAVMEPVYRFVNETPQRVGMGDWYDTANGRHLFMHSRPVVGGVFLQLLYDQAVWKKWAGRDQTKAVGWAPMPQPPKITPVVPAADTTPANWRYTITKPADDWIKPGFDDAGWSRGQGGFGTRGTPGAVVGTIWNTSDIWLRCEVEIPADKLNKLVLWLHHDEDVQIYANGVLVADLGGYSTEYEAVSISPALREVFKPGKNHLAVHCRQTQGGQYVDLGLASMDAQ